MTPRRPVPRRGRKKFEKEFAEAQRLDKKPTLSAKMYIFALMTICRCTADYIPAEPVMLEENPAAGPESASEDERLNSLYLSTGLQSAFTALRILPTAWASMQLSTMTATGWTSSCRTCAVTDGATAIMSVWAMMTAVTFCAGSTGSWKKILRPRIILHGISMGAATVLMTTGYNLPKQVVAAVSDSSYTSAVDVLTFAYKKEDAAVVPAPVMLEALRAIALVQAGYDIRKAAPIQAVAHSKTPTLFIHGQADGLVPPRMMPALYKAASCEKAFLWIPEADHVQSVNVDPETYWARVERFLHAHEIPLM